MKASLTEARPIADWMQVLEQIESSVTRRLAQVEEPADADVDPSPTTTTPLETLEGRLAQMQVRLDHAERDAAEVDAELGAASEGYEHWIADMTVALGRLADGAGRVSNL